MENCDDVVAPRPVQPPKTGMRVVTPGRPQCTGFRNRNTFQGDTPEVVVVLHRPLSFTELPRLADNSRSRYFRGAVGARRQSYAVYISSFVACDLLFTCQHRLRPDTTSSSDASPKCQYCGRQWSPISKESSPDGGAPSALQAAPERCLRSSLHSDS